MKKSLKNCIMIGMAVVLLGTSAVTYCYASEGKAGAPDFAFSQQAPDFGNSNHQNPLENFGQENNSNNNSNNNMPQPPQSGNNQQPPAQNGQPPQQNDNSSQDGNATQNDDADTTTQATPNDQGTSADSSDVDIIDTDRGMPQMQNRHGKSDALTVACYLFMALQLGIVVLILCYLAFSKGNKLSYKQTVARFGK